MTPLYEMRLQQAKLIAELLRALRRRILRSYWNSRIVGDEEFGYSVTHKKSAMWSSKRETLLDMLCK